MLKIKKLTKKFGSKVAVGDVSFAIKSGEIFSLIGPNGSGKTTIVKTISALLKPTKGSISVCGLDIEKKPELAKAQLGYIPDEPSIWPMMTGQEFLFFVGSLYSLPAKIIRKRISQLLAIFQLDSIKDDYFEDYSRGNKQKFSILAALLHEPKVLLVDEPIVGLDPTSAIVAKKQFVDFAKKGGSVLLVTHTLSVAQEISDRIGILKNGKLITTGTMAQLQKKAKKKKKVSLEEIYLTLTAD